MNHDTTPSMSMERTHTHTYTYTYTHTKRTDRRSDEIEELSNARLIRHIVEEVKELCIARRRAAEHAQESVDMAFQHD